MRNNRIFTKIIEKIMSAHDGHASNSLLYREFERIRGDYPALRGKTPDSSIRRELQRMVEEGRIERIGLGVYARKGAELPVAPPANTIKEKKERRHSDIQGMLLEIGNNRPECANTYTPDRGQIFNNMRLGNIATVESMPPFTYPRIIDSVRHVDVIWFNDRGFPGAMFEVEHSTNFLSAMTKFCDMQDFLVRLCCVAEESRRDKFQRALKRAAFTAIKDRCEFHSYESIESDYETAKRKLHI